MRILIVDDSVDARTVAKARLSAEGHEIICAEGGQIGLDLAAKENPDLILLDVDMPGMSGFEVCRKLKSNDELHLIPVIFVSGSGDAGDKVIGLDLGAIDYVTKPFDAFELRARVRAALRTKRLQDILRDKALIDPLTELGNRRAFDERLRLEWSRAARYNLQLALIMADIDHFKDINDQYGHQIGDEVLRRISCRLSACLRECDAIYRYGGEEFGTLLPETSLSGAIELAQRLCAQISAEPLQIGNQTLKVSASFGAASNQDVNDPESLVGAADEQLYEAKGDGRNCVRPLINAPVQNQR
ncbi:MAG: diguanylate cyclase [Planctomycetes bacterium]|nr:diguanylate cyclase [Planctomycetota bacterium]